MQRAFCTQFLEYFEFDSILKQTCHLYYAQPKIDTLQTNQRS